MSIQKNIVLFHPKLLAQQLFKDNFIFDTNKSCTLKCDFAHVMD